MVGWHQQFNVHELGPTPGDGERQESLACCSPQDCKELDNRQDMYPCWDYAHLSLNLSSEDKYYVLGGIPDLDNK